VNKVAVPEGAAGSPPFREWPECVRTAMRVTARTSQLKSCSNASHRTAKISEQSRRVPGCSVAWSTRASEWEGRPAGSGNLQKINARQERGAPGARGYYVASRKSLHASAVKGTGCAGPTRAFSSVGESARLITVRSVVRIHKGPRSYPIGDVAQLEEHLLCKQGVAGSSPAISTGNTLPLCPPVAVAGFLYVDTRIASLREHWTVSVVQRSSENPQQQTSQANTRVVSR
jgi:hypothetical protein